MNAAQGTLARIAAALGMSIEALVSETGEAAYMRQCSELLYLFARLPDEHAREQCLGLVRALVAGISVG